MKLTVTTMLLAAMILGVIVQVAVGQDSYNCGGSTLCSGPLITQPQCDEAMRKIDPNARYSTSGGKTGACAGHCGVFVGGGSNCNLSGRQMLDAYNELRARKCAKCGVKTYPNGCQLKVDYVARC